MGTCAGKIATCVGAAEQVPGVLLKGTLIFSEQQPPAPPVARAAIVDQR